MDKWKFFKFSLVMLVRTASKTGYNLQLETLPDSKLSHLIFRIGFSIINFHWLQMLACIYFVHSIETFSRDDVKLHLISNE